MQLSQQASTRLGPWLQLELRLAGRATQSFVATSHFFLYFANYIKEALLCRWLVLDTDSKDLVTVHTDGNEQLSVMSYGPGVESFIFRRLHFFIYLYLLV